MGFFDKLKKAKGGYIFLSHSHDDIEQVREIRNSLEKDGFEPLCFYLKCLDDDSEIEDLIKREIDAREWFVFVNSENARKSRWVTLEREYIESTNSKKIITVDLEDAAAVHGVVEKIARNLRIFISCASKNAGLAYRIKKKLEEKDYLVFYAQDSIAAGAPYDETVYGAIVEASQEGGVMVILTPESVESVWVQKELELAVMRRGNLIPVMVGDVELSDPLEFYLGGYQHYHLSENPTDGEIMQMVECIGRDILAH